MLEKIRLAIKLYLSTNTKYLYVNYFTIYMYFVLTKLPCISSIITLGVFLIK